MEKKSKHVQLFSMLYEKLLQTMSLSSKLHEKFNVQNVMKDIFKSAADFDVMLCTLLKHFKMPQNCCIRQNKQRANRNRNKLSLKD